MVAAIGICFGSFKLSFGFFNEPGPGFFSLLAGALLGILSFVLFLKSFKGESGKESKPFWPNPQRRLQMAGLVIALTLYVIGMDYLGFFLSTVLFLGFLLKVISLQKWSVVLTVSILSTIISFGVLKYWFGVQLPAGIFID